MTIRKLGSDDLYRRCDLAAADFHTTADLEPLDDVIGQERAVEAVRFGIGIQHDGYNLYALGPNGIGKSSLVKRYLGEQAGTEPVPSDWCYVNNFQQAHMPRVLELPAGRGKALQADMEHLVEDLYAAIPAVFESDEYRTRSQVIEAEFNERQEQTLNRIQEEANRRGIGLIHTPSGFTLAPVRDGEVVSGEDFEALPEDERKRIEKDVEELQKELIDALHEVPKWQKEMRKQVGELNREMAAFAVGNLVDSLRKSYQDLPVVVSYLDDVESDVVSHFRDFLHAEGKKTVFPGLEIPAGGATTVRYQVNPLITHDDDEGAPVVHEDNPTYLNLIGRVEHRAHLGALETDFTMIRPGALHRANGGYLVVDALKVLVQPFAWEALKRALRSHEIRMESLGQQYSLVSTVSLEPQPIPLDVKVVLLGDRRIYYLLAYLDPDFAELFKVAADFDDRMVRDDASQLLYARLVATMVQRSALLDFDRAAVERVVEFGAREVGDAERLSTHMRSIEDLLCEADHQARQRESDHVTSEDVQHAIDAGIRRASRIRDRIQEEIGRGTVFIDTDGERIGQINGLSIISLGQYMFGQPSRITARVRVGNRQVVDIEREVELGGPIHSKGVYILSGYLGARYALDFPLTLSASLAFEQSYSEVEGDSASSAELYALLSALADVPIRQSLAVTGSVNQNGEVQPIGGVNEKIEGFYDVCHERGLTGEQGVIIPEANVKHLMLRPDICTAVAEGHFHVHAVSRIDDGIELLTGVPAGERGETGEFPAGSINRRVEDRLIGFAERLRDFRSRREGDLVPGDDGGG